MIRLAVYELTKLIAPNNVSVVRMRDYEDSMKWLNDASKLRINPQIPRKIAEDNKPVTDWQMATFQTSYDPYKNPWQIWKDFITTTESPRYYWHSVLVTQSRLARLC